MWFLMVVKGEVGVGIDHQDVLVLDVAMDDSSLLAGQDGVDNLLEKPLGHLFFQHTSLCDEVKQVLAVWGTLHDEDERVGPLVKVHQANDPGDSRNIPEQANFQRNRFSILRLKIENMLLVAHSR